MTEPRSPTSAFPAAPRGHASLRPCLFPQASSNQSLLRKGHAKAQSPSKPWGMPPPSSVSTSNPPPCHPTLGDHIISARSFSPQGWSPFSENAQMTPHILYVSLINCSITQIFHSLQRMQMTLSATFNIFLPR